MGRTIRRKREGASSAGLSYTKCQCDAAMAGDADTAVARQSGWVRLDDITDSARVAVPGRQVPNPRCECARRPDAARESVYRK